MLVTYHIEYGPEGHTKAREFDVQLEYARMHAQRLSRQMKGEEIYMVASLTTGWGRGAQLEVVGHEIYVDGKREHRQGMIEQLKN
jgi:hypothetical protein